MPSVPPLVTALTRGSKLWKLVEIIVVNMMAWWDKVLDFQFKPRPDFSNHVISLDMIDMKNNLIDVIGNICKDY